MTLSKLRRSLKKVISLTGRSISWPTVLVAFVAITFGAMYASCKSVQNNASNIGSAPSLPSATVSNSNQKTGAQKINTGIGFASHRKLVEHYEKHGREFGSISMDEYLRQAQEMRDRPLSKDLLEAKRGDNVVTRFDRQTGAFLAFNSDLTIRTFFKPNAGENYFRRQAKRLPRNDE